MKFWYLIAIVLFLVATYFLAGWLFGLSVFVIIVYVSYRIYRLIERLATPHGRRIKHGLLKGHLEAEYGTAQGKKLYKEMVGELRKKGYR